MPNPPAKTSLPAWPRRLAALTFAASLLLCKLPARAGEIELPDFGLSASAAITEAQENAYGEELLRLMRNYRVLVEDPIVDEYLNTLANRLVLASRRPEQRFRFVLFNDPEINAFAVPGGLIAVHAGLVLAASQESELAAVLAHEIAHVTQKHIVRAQERQRLASIPILLASLGAAIAASRSSSGDGAPAAMIGGQALMQQLAINYTRDNEFEADRIGIQTLSKAGFDVYAMPRMFGILSRSFHIAPEEEPPAYLRTHPLNTTRIAEAAGRAERLAVAGAQAQSTAYILVRERVRVLAGEDPNKLLARYQRLEAQGSRSPGTPYGHALALIRLHRFDAAELELAKLEELGDELIVKLAQVELDVARGRPERWRPHLADLERLYPQHTVIATVHAEALMGLGTAEAGDAAREVLRRLIRPGSDNPELYERLGRANELAGSPVRAGEAHARAAALRGAYERALLQLRELSRRNDLDYYARARIDAQIAALTPVVMEVRRSSGRQDPG